MFRGGTFRSCYILANKQYFCTYDHLTYSRTGRLLVGEEEVYTLIVRKLESIILQPTGMHTFWHGTTHQVRHAPSAVFLSGRLGFQRPFTYS